MTVESVDESAYHCAFHCALSSKFASNKWCLDSGATSHMSAVKEKFASISAVSSSIALANSGSSAVEGAGNVRIKLFDGQGGRPTTLLNTLHVPELRTNLMSVSKITDQGSIVTFRKDEAYVLDESEKVLAVAKRSGDLYFVSEVPDTANVAKAVPKSQIMEWHEKLGHLNEVSLKNMAKNRGLEMKLGKDDKLALCEICIQGKQVQAPFPERKSPRTSDLLEVVHTDVCGPLRTASKGGAKSVLPISADCR